MNIIYCSYCWRPHEQMGLYIKLWLTSLRLCQCDFWGDIVLCRTGCSPLVLQRICGLWKLKTSLTRRRRVLRILWLESMGNGSRTTPHEDNSPPDKNKAQPLPTGTTIPRTIPHQDNSPLGPLHGIKPLIRTKTCTMGNYPPGELSGYDGKCVL